MRSMRKFVRSMRVDIDAYGIANIPRRPFDMPEAVCDHVDIVYHPRHVFPHSAQVFENQISVSAVITLSYSAASATARSASAEHSAITAEARAIGFVK